MSFRNVGSLLTAALLGAGSLGLSLSCSAPDPGEVTFIERKPTGIEQTGSSGDPTSSSSSSSSTSSTSSSGDAGTTSSTGGIPTDAFAGAGAFVAGTNPGNSTQTAHGANPNPAGRNCLTAGCHDGTATAPKWAFGGTVYDNAGTPVVGAEVRGLDKTGKALPTKLYTDVNGNFWSDETTFVPVKVGVRNAASMKQMSSLLDSTKGEMGCQKALCHNTATQPKITVN